MVSPDKRVSPSYEETLHLGDDEITEHDRDPSNLQLRAGYLRGLAECVTRAEDRLVLLRASRSLRAYADSLLDAARARK